MQHITEWKKVNRRKLQCSTGSKGVIQQHKKWLCPEVGEFKINVDASVFMGENYFSVGMVLRNHKGEYINGKTLCFTGQVSVMEADLVDILEGLLWAEELNSGAIKVESDSKLSIEAINNNAVNLLSWAILYIIADPSLETMVGFQLVLLESK